jgi:hypothetical protein
VYPALAAAHPQGVWMARFGSTVLQLPRYRYYPVRSVYILAIQHSPKDIRLWSRHSREFAVLQPSHQCFGPGCQLHMSESCRKSSALSKALSTASAGHWAGKCEQGKQGTWRSILDAMGAAQGSATSKSKQGSVRRV